MYSSLKSRVFSFQKGIIAEISELSEAIHPLFTQGFHQASFPGSSSFKSKFDILCESSPFFIMLSAECDKGLLILFIFSKNQLLFLLIFALVSTYFSFISAGIFIISFLPKTNFGFVLLLLFFF